MAVVPASSRGGSLDLPLNLGPGLFQVSATGAITSAPSAGTTALLNALGVAGFKTVTQFGAGFVGIEYDDHVGTVGGFYVNSAGLDAVPSATGYVALDDKDGVSVVEVGHDGKLAFFGGARVVQQALTSGTATPEQIALALEASTLMGGT